MIPFIRLTRPLNLVIIVLTMMLLRYGVLGGLVNAGGRLLQLSDLMFALLVLSTVLIAAAGNVINDYFDQKIDRINKPDQVIVGRHVKRRVAMTGHFVLSISGMLVGTFVAWMVGRLQLAMVPVFAAVCLWYYSTTFKRKFMIGNLTVALMTAMVPMLVGLYEIPLLRAHYEPEMLDMWGEQDFVNGYFRILWAWIIGYALFAFWSTLVRELQKDMADVPGDRAAGCRTVPIVWGMNASRLLAVFHIGIIVSGLLFVRKQWLDDDLSFWYIALAIILPLLVTAALTYTARTRNEHVRAGNVMKLSMVMAVGYAALIGLVLT